MAEEEARGDLCDELVPGDFGIDVLGESDVPAFMAGEGSIVEEGVVLAGRPGGVVGEFEVEFEIEEFEEVECGGG